MTSLAYHSSYGQGVRAGVFRERVRRYRSKWGRRSGNRKGGAIQHEVVAEAHPAHTSHRGLAMSRSASNIEVRALRILEHELPEECIENEESQDKQHLDYTLHLRVKDSPFWNSVRRLDLRLYRDVGDSVPSPVIVETAMEAAEDPKTE